MSKSNQTGNQGEEYFAYWASKHRLAATKAKTDIGVDYLCQVLAPVDQSESWEGTGSMIGAQVKTVADSPNPNLKLDRKDAMDLLRQAQATCLIGVLLATEEVYFRFLDETVIDLLLDFLATKDKSTSFNFDQMSNDPKAFEEALPDITNSFRQAQLRVYLLKQRIHRAIPGSDVEVVSGSQATTSHVRVPSINDVFSIRPEAHASVRAQIFEDGLIDPNTVGVDFHEEIRRLIAQTRSRQVTILGAAESVETVTLTSGADTAKQIFALRQFGDEWALVHEAGLRLTLSSARKTKNGYVHFVESTIFAPKFAHPLNKATFRFFSLLKPGASLCIGQGKPFPLATFGTSAQTIGPAVEAYLLLAEGLEISSSDFQLSDLLDEEFARTLFVLDQLLLKGATLAHILPGFVIGPGARNPKKKLPTEPVEARIPLVLNWKAIGIEIWVECTAEAFVYETKFCGFRVVSQRSWTIQKTEHWKKSIYPEAWFFSDWPPIHIGSKVKPVSTWTPSEGLPLEAEIRRVSADQETEAP
ncbi:protein of unknown function [Bryocella elongata]|uniref:DUF4365 domain-containing protein n=1 Tax=Bryocella elongata TaxID=863522 RepID=A0A1H6CDQ4_9BACT|nr:hypothetical protein [Bryocella elongata]SEG71121.1 protein of unknown function [Bryocella elongata]